MKYLHFIAEVVGFAFIGLFLISAVWGLISHLKNDMGPVPDDTDDNE